MNWRALSVLVLAGLLAACGEADNGGGDGGGGGGGNPPPSPAFTLGFSPDRAAFRVDKNSSAVLTISDNIAWDEIKKVRVTLTSNVSGLSFSETAPVIAAGGSVSVTVTATAALTNPRPSFTVNAVGLDKDNRPKGESPPPTVFQWSVQ